MEGTAVFCRWSICALLVAACGGQPFKSGGKGAGGRQSSEASVHVPDAATGDIGEGGASSTGNGGTTTSGGVSTSGGVTAAGGAIGNGGMMATGGVRAAGGTTSTGGTSAGGAAPMMDAGSPEACGSLADCPASGSVCQKAVCLGGQCGFVAVPSAVPANTPGDCRTVVCSQSGTETILTDPTDTNDGNECTADSCQGSVAKHTPSVGARCQNGARFCDASGGCVACIDDTQCTKGTDECSAATCVHGTCQIPAAGAFCHAGKDQCDGQGTCVDCWDSNGCESCCFCLSGLCVQG